MTKSIMIEVGAGEMIDKITILQIKSERINDTEKLKNIHYELSILNQTYATYFSPSQELKELEQRLKSINEALWDIEDDIRLHEAHKDFGEKFIALARSVYLTNDKRATIKREINILTGAFFIEEKSYTEF